MVPQISVLVALVDLVDQLPGPPPRPRRGGPPTYPDRLFLKALVVMLGRGVPTVGGLLAILAQPTAELRARRARLTEGGHCPARRTWERRLNARSATVPARIGGLGRELVAQLRPWEDYGRAAAIDSPVLRARGGVWHKQDREAGIVPLRSIDSQAHGTKSGWHGRVSGWKLHPVTTGAAVWIPPAAELPPANGADNEVAPGRLPELPPELRLLLGDTNSNAPTLREQCAAADLALVTGKHARYPPADPGVEVRRVFHKLRSVANENFNEQFTGLVDAHGSGPTRGLARTQRWALGAVVVYQLTLLSRFEHGDDRRVGLKAFLKAA